MWIQAIPGYRGLCWVQLGGCVPLSLRCAEAELSAAIWDSQEKKGGAGTTPRPQQQSQNDNCVPYRTVSSALFLTLPPLRRSRVAIAGESKAPFRRLDLAGCRLGLCNRVVSS